MHTNNIHITSTTLSPYTCSSTHLSQQENNILQHTPQTFTASLSQAQLSPSLYLNTTESSETLIYPSTSCQPNNPEQSRRKRLKRQKDADIRGKKIKETTKFVSDIIK